MNHNKAHKDPGCLFLFIIWVVIRCKLVKDIWYHPDMPLNVDHMWGTLYCSIWEIVPCSLKYFEQYSFAITKYSLILPQERVKKQKSIFKLYLISLTSIIST